MKTINIYGEYVEGEEIEYLEDTPKNVIIIKDVSGVKHVIHKETLNPKFKRKARRAGVKFDLLACQANGRKGPIRKWRRIS